jgi:hypothetical protein
LTKNRTFGIDEASAVAGKDAFQEAEMPGDPKECVSTHSRARNLPEPHHRHKPRDQFASLANTWLRLAAELEQAQALLDAVYDETEPIRRTG